MKPFAKDEFVKILSTLWDRIFDTPEIIASVSGVKIIVKFRFSDLETDFFIDNSGDTPRYYWDPGDDAPFDVEMIQSSENSHKFWMEDLNVPLAIASRKIIAKGSVQKALKLLPALKPAFSLYPGVLKDLGRDDLLKISHGKKKRRKFKLFRKKRSKEFRKDMIPDVPIQFLDEKSDEGKEGKAVQRDTVSDLNLLETMRKIRAFEQKLSKEFSQGNLPTEAIHLSIGQEAVAAGVCMNLRDTDYLNTTHRGHGHILAKGADVRKMMAEIYGKADGLCSGKGGSMHVTDGSLGILGANGIVGAGYLLALGAGFSIKNLKKTDDISVVIAGDGSVNQGMFHEAMNMISVFELPVLVVVENNLYGEFTSIERHSALTEVYKRADAYNIESYCFDGNDARIVFSETGKIIDKIRKDGKPRMIELKTYRWHGHMEGDPELYRTEEEKNKFKNEDPIPKLEKLLIQEGTATQEEIDSIRRRADTAIEEAATFAEKAENPKGSELQTDVYCPDDKILYSGSFESDFEFKEVSVSQAINLAIAQEMEQDHRVFLWGEDVTLGGYFNVSEGLVDTFGKERIIDTPISENGFVGGAVGAAMTGMRPIAEILFADFLTCCMDPILNQAAKLRYMTGGQVSIPLTVRSPLGKARVIREGTDATIVTYLLGVSIAMDASKILEAKGIDVEVIDLATLYPMDTETILSSIAKTGFLVTVEEGTFSGSIGSEIISRTAIAGFQLLNSAPVKIAAPECPVPYAKNLENAMMPSPEQVAETIEDALG
jgi:2-oxoisovalerate dehydrogenase E1 component